MKNNRRQFLKQSSQWALGATLLSPLFLTSCGEVTTTSTSAKDKTANTTDPPKEAAMFFKISLAQWSLHRALGMRDEKATMDNLDFAAKAKNDFGIGAIEYVNQFFKDKATDMDYLKEMKKRATDNGVESLLIMIDGEGGLGDLDDAKRTEAIENHYKWVEAAKFLGCHSIRVNAFGKGSAEEVAKAATDGLGRLATFAKKSNINVIVENHGSYSSDGNWMSNVINQVGMDNCGMLPDFGNFCVERDNGEAWGGNCIKEFDRYEGVKLFMPTAKAVSAKTHDFDAEGNETNTNYTKMMQIVKDAGYRGYIGIEYEGETLSEEDGIRKTIALLKRVGKAIS